MESWLESFDRAVRALQTADRLPELHRALKDHQFPIDWIPEDAATMGARKPLYPMSLPSTSGKVAATAVDTKKEGKLKPRNRSLLMCAAKFGRPECAAALITSYGANVRCVSAFDGVSALHVAATYGKTEVLQVLMGFARSSCRAFTNKCVTAPVVFVAPVACPTVLRFPRRAGETLLDIARKCGHLHKFASAGLDLTPSDDDCIAPPGDASSNSFRFPSESSVDIDAIIQKSPRSDSIDHWDTAVANAWYLYAKFRPRVAGDHVPTPSCLYPPRQWRYPAAYTRTSIGGLSVVDGPLRDMFEPVEFSSVPYISPAQAAPDAVFLTVHRSSCVATGGMLVVKRDALKAPASSKVNNACNTDAFAPGTRPFKIPKPLEYKGTFVIGRDVSTKLQDKQRGYSVPDYRASKAHAVLRYNAHALLFEIADAGSSNGTLLNGQRLSVCKECSPWHPLYDGATVTIGSVPC